MFIIYFVTNIPQKVVGCTQQFILLLVIVKFQQVYTEIRFHKKLFFLELGLHFRSYMLQLTKH